MDWTVALGEIELYGLGAGYIEGYGAQLQNVTLPQMQAVIEDAFPPPDEVTIVLIGDAAAYAALIGAGTP